MLEEIGNFWSYQCAVDCTICNPQQRKCQVVKSHVAVSFHGRWSLPQITFRYTANLNPNRNRNRRP